MTEEILNFIEFETKYRTEESKRFPFKRIMEDELGLTGDRFFYVQSGDEYFTLNLNDKIFEFIKHHSDSSPFMEEHSGTISVFIEDFVSNFLGLPKFLRFRASDHKKNKRKELTFKKKHKTANNIKRTEVNLRVDASDNDTTREFAEGLGYSKAFDVYKYCDIYYADDAVMVFYSVKDNDGKLNHFIEIEVNEEMDFTESQAWDIIKKYEKILEPVGVKAQGRIRKSLFEMYNPKK